MLPSYFKLFTMEIKRSKEYYLSFLSTLLYMPVSLAIYYFLFRYLLQSSASFPMTLSEILHYYTVVLFIRSALQSAMTEVYYVFRDINQGLLDAWLTRPVKYLLCRYCRALGCVALTMPTSLVLLGVFFWGKYPAGNILGFFLAVLLGFTVLFLLMFLLGSLTFWLKSVLTLRDIFWVVLTIFSGELVPLSLLPEPLRFLQNNPLACVYDVPYQVLSSENFLPLLALQATHILLLWGLASLAWRLGIARYESQGG